MTDLDVELLKIDREKEVAEADRATIEALLGMHAGNGLDISDVNAMHLETESHQYRGRVRVNPETGDVIKVNPKAGEVIKPLVIYEKL